MGLPIQVLALNRGGGHQAQLITHAVQGDHMPRQRGGLLNIVGSAVGLDSEYHLLCCPAAQDAPQLRQQLILGGQELFLFRQVHGVAQSAFGVGNDGDLGHGHGPLFQGGDQGMAHLVVGNQTFFRLGQHGVLLLRAGNHRIDGGHQVLLIHRLTAHADRPQGSLIDKVGQVRADAAGSCLGDLLQVYIFAELDLPGMDLQGIQTALKIGAVHNDPAVKTAGTKQCLIQDLRTVGGCQAHDALGGIEAVNFCQQLVQRLFLLGVGAIAAVAGTTHRIDLINKDNVHEYAPVGCLENTMVGNDRSGTVDNNINLLKAMELVYGNGKDMEPYPDPMGGPPSKLTQDGPKTGTLAELDTWDKFYNAFKEQTKYMIRRMVENYELSESIRCEFNPTPYLSTLVGGCAEKGLDITRGGAELSFVTMEGVTYASTVDSLLAVKYLVYDQKECTLEELVKALYANWEGYEVLQAKAQYKAPKYGRDDDVADAFAKEYMEFWSNEVWKYKTKSTNRQFRPGMLSWNYWIGSSYILKASANGRKQNQFLSNAICPSNGADTNGPTSNSNSVGTALGGKAEQGDYEDYVNVLPNGASHTITFNTSLIRDPDHKEKFKSFIKGYIRNGGTALQVNILDPDVLRDAQEHPQDYRHLLVRITGYNAYFVTVGRELQDEIIARESHMGY